MRALGTAIIAACLFIHGHALASDQNSGGYLTLSIEQADRQTKGLQKPSYPSEFRKRNLEATMTLRLWVSATGKVERVEAVRHQGAQELVDFAVSFVKQNWRFPPYIHQGKPTPVRLDTPMFFILIPAQGAAGR